MDKIGHHPGEGSDERRQLGRDRIAAAALVLIDDAGLSALSMRKLGAVLGVEAMSIYHYVTSKDDLLDAVLESLYRKIQIDDPTEDQRWDQVVRGAVRSFHDVLLMHPNTVTLFAARPAALSNEGFAVIFGGFRLLRLCGLGPEEAHGALHAAIAFVLGHAVETAGAQESGRSIDLIGEHLLEDPDVAEFVVSGRHLTSAVLFERGVDLLIAGLRSEYKLP